MEIIVHILFNIGLKESRSLLDDSHKFTGGDRNMHYKN